MICVIDGLGTGGAERSLAELLPGLVAADIEPTIACLNHRPAGVEKHVVAADYDVRFLPRGAGSRLVALRRVINEIAPDLVQTTLVGSSLVGRFAAAGKHVPVLTTLVSQTYAPERRVDPYGRPVALRSVRMVDGWTARHLTTHFHAITNAVKRSAETALGIPGERITVVERGRDPRRLGVPSPERRAAARERLGLPREAEVIVAAGRQEFAKGHRFLVEAMTQIADEHPSALLLLAGRDGAETEHLRELTLQQPLNRIVRFLGHREDLPDVLAASDLFVFPSLWEGLGGALIEAMALGLPIVASDLEPVREVVEEGRCALLVPPRSPAHLAKAVSALLDDRSRARELAARGREIFLRRFTLERSTERMIALVRQVAMSPGRSLDGMRT